jgi:hypothetical protein
MFTPPLEIAQIRPCPNFRAFHWFARERSWAIMSALDGRARRCRRRKDPFILLALVKATQRLLSCCSLTWAHPFRTASRLDCLRFAVTFELAQFVILHDPEHEWAFLNNFNSSPVFSIADSLLHHPFKNLGPSPHLIYPTSASVAERRGLRKLMISRSFCGKAGLQLWMQASALLVVAPFLQYPAVSIRIGEVGEASIISARRVEPGCETSVPGSNWRLVPDLADLDSTFDQAAPGGLEVRDHEVDLAE